MIGSLHRSRARSVSEISPLHSFLDKISDVFIWETGLARLPRSELLLHGLLHQRAKWIKSCAVIGYPSGKVEVSCPLRTTRRVPRENFSRKPSIYPLLTKFARSRWLDIGLVLFIASLNLDSVRVRKHARKNLANIQSSWPHPWSITHTYITLELGWPGRSCEKGMRGFEMVVFASWTRSKSLSKTRVTWVPRNFS